MENLTYSKNLTAKGSYDVIVCGGGVAGVSAALGCAQRGKSTLLIEKSTLLGGVSDPALQYFSFWPYRPR